MSWRDDKDMNPEAFEEGELKICPLLKKECIAEKCAWYSATLDTGDVLCRMEMIEGLLCDVLSELQLKKIKN